ncbi:MAG TPA: PAS domain S-box protein [Dermatophilaceae bacterium]
MHPLPVNADDLLAAVPDALIGVDLDGRIRFVNERAALLFGYDPDDLFDQPVEVLLPESLRAVHGVHRSKYNETPTIRAMGDGLKLTARRRDGTQLPVDVALSHLQTADGLLVVAAVRDMAGRTIPGLDRRGRIR